jgi:predicted Zn-dependent protease
MKKIFPMQFLIPVLLLSGCATFEGDRSSNTVLSSNNDPVILFSEEQERALGLESAKAALQQYKPLNNPAVQAYVSGLGKRLAKFSDRPALDYQFTVVDSPEVNAFACPGGFIFVTSGILKKLKDESELGAVLGHETGHVVRQHALKSMQRQFIAQNGLAVLTALLGGKSGQLVEQFGPLAGNLLLLRNGREAELEADEQGLLITSRAGLDPAGMVGVQRMLLTEGGGGSGAFAEIFASHPPSEQRIQQAEKLLPKYQGATERGAQRYRDNVLAKL